jgi:hypothetical protein
MLQQAALDSAQQSQFECRQCSTEVTPYVLTYSFEIADVPPAEQAKTIIDAIQSENRVRVITEPRPIHIQFAYIGVRSAKCLYLWRCGYRWGGEDYYYYRVHSAKCLYLWRCGLRRRG